MCVVNIGYIGSRIWFKLKFNRTKFSAEQIRFPLLTFRHWLTNFRRLHDSLRVGVYTGSSKTSWSLSVFLFLTPCICLVWFQTSNRVEFSSVVFVVPNLSGGGGTSHFNLLKPLSLNFTTKSSTYNNSGHSEKQKHDKNWVLKLPNVIGGKWEGVICFFTRK